MKETIKMIKSMDMEYLLGNLEISIKGSTLKMKGKDMERCIG